MAAAADNEAGMDGRVSFDEFIRLLEQAGPAGPLEGPDPKVRSPPSTIALLYISSCLSLSGLNQQIDFRHIAGPR